MIITEDFGWKLIFSLFKKFYLNAKELPYDICEYNTKGRDSNLFEILGLSNRYVPYVFLLDSQRNIRWKAVGDPLQTELSQAYNVIKSLELENKDIKSYDFVKFSDTNIFFEKFKVIKVTNKIAFAASKSVCLLRLGRLFSLRKCSLLCDSLEMDDFEDFVSRICSSYGCNLDRKSQAYLTSASFGALANVLQSAKSIMFHSKKEKLTEILTKSAIERFCESKSVSMNTEYYTEQFEDHEYDTDDIIDISETGVASQAPTLSVHWLAVEGNKPVVPENETSIPNDPTQLIIEKDKENEREVQGSVPSIKYSLSKEMLLYYDKVISIISSGSDVKMEVICEYISTDHHIQPLMPHLIHYIADQVLHNQKKTKLLYRLMSLSNSLLRNNNLTLDPYLHQLLPSVLTCLLHKYLCESPLEDHWSVRELAADVIARICKRYGKNYVHLQSHISDTLINAILDTSKPLTTHYGAIMGIYKLGPHISAILLIPILKSYLNVLINSTSSSSATTTTTTIENKIKYKETQKCIELLTTVYAECIYHYFKTLSNDLNSWNQQDIYENLFKSDNLIKDLQTVELLPLFDQHQLLNNVKRFIDTNNSIK